MTLNEVLKNTNYELSLFSEEGKQAVEMAIEQGEGVALKWLKDKIPVEV